MVNSLGDGQEKNEITEDSSEIETSIEYLSETLSNNSLSGLGIDDPEYFVNEVMYSTKLNENKNNFMARVNDSWNWPTYKFWTTTGYNGSSTVEAVKIGPGFTSWNIYSYATEGTFRDTLMRALQNSFGATNGRINGNLSWINTLWDWETAGRGRVNNLWDWSYRVNDKNTAQDGYINTLWDWETAGRGRVDELWTWSGEADRSINKLWDWETTGRTRVNSLWTWSTKVDGYINKLWDWETTGRTRVNNLWDWNTSGRDRLNNLWDWSYMVIDKDKAQDDSIDELWTWSGEADRSINKLWDWETTGRTRVNSLWDWNTFGRDRLNNLWDWSYTVIDKDKAQDNTIDQLLTWSAEDESSINQLWDWETTGRSQLYDLDDRVQAIENYNLSDLIDLTIVVHAIDVVRDKTIEVKEAIDSLKTVLVAQIVLIITELDGLKSEIIDLASLFKSDGAFQTFLTGTIKSQTLAIVDGLAMVDETIKTTFSNYFTDSENGVFWVAYKNFSDFQMAVFFGVLFETLREDWDKNWTEILITWNLTNDLLLLNNDWSEIMNDWLDMINTKLINTNDILAIVTNWLKLIYEKPIPTFNVPVFDYARLEKMLKKLEFGEITNEAGTNIWDFLKELVKGLTDSLLGILDFLDNLLDKLIALLIPENMDFLTASFEQVKLKFDVKFSGFLSLADDIKEMFQPIQKDVASELTFDFLGVEFKPQMSILDSFVPKFRGLAALMLWFHTGWYVFMRFTGGGDLINDN